MAEREGLIFDLSPATNTSRIQMNFSSPLGKVLAELRDGPKTIDEIAEGLRLSPNAVRNQIRKLVSAHLAAATGRRAGVSKPAVLYSITLDGEIQFSTIYLPVLSQFLRVAEGQCSGKQLGAFMSATGRTLAKRYEKPSGSTKERVHAAAKLLGTFGGIPSVQKRNGDFVITSKACPLSALTSEHNAACRILQGLISEYVERPTQICCIHGEDPRCCFELKA
ncbi:MAG: helix-turn-helix transcriptional regulator [Gemmatimonadaceae bacterium]